MSLFSSLSVSGSGMSAQRTRAELLVENLANAETTRTPEGGPYRRKDVVFEEDPSVGSFNSELSSAMGSGVSGVSASQTIIDDSEPLPPLHAGTSGRRRGTDMSLFRRSTQPRTWWI